MSASWLYKITRLPDLTRMIGPILDKELRVSSRRRRNYVLRFIYLAWLLVFISFVWLQFVQYRGYSSALYQASRMAEAGKYIVVMIVWFQFLATQLIAIIMLSNAISDEIYHKTLGTLMTTPINSFQIVIGKLLSKLLQVILLLAISLPLLAIVRVFGGVPWDYVLLSLGITLTSVLFIASLSLFYSILCRRSYIVIIFTILTLAGIFLLVPFLAISIYNVFDYHRSSESDTFYTILFTPHPYVVMESLTSAMFMPRFGGPSFSNGYHMAIMFTASVFLLGISIRLVRKAALRQATGQELFVSRKRRNISKNKISPRYDPAKIPLRRVSDRPVLWKELKSPFFHGRNVTAALVIGAAIVLLLFTYCLCVEEASLEDDDTHMAYGCIFQCLGLLFTIVIPAACITSEKEARTWQTLLATPLEDREIFVGKFIGALRRCLPIWIPLFAHIIIFSAIGYIHHYAIHQMAIVTAWILVFFICTGIYFSTLFKRTTTAVIMNFVLGLTIWAFIPLVMSMWLVLQDGSEDLVEWYMDFNPVFQGLLIMYETTMNDGWGYYHNVHYVHNYDWMGQRDLSPRDSTIFMFKCMVGYMAIGSLFAWRSMCRFRRRIF